MKKTIIFSGLILTFGFVSLLYAVENINKDNYPKLIIIEKVSKNYDVDKIEFTVRTRNFDHDYPNTAFIYNSLKINQIPKETVYYTKWLIAKRFFPNPLRYGDRFGEITIKNYKEKVVFDLLLTEEMDENNNPTGNWIYYLTVAQKPNGKKFSIADFTISSENRILKNYKYKW